MLADGLRGEVHDPTSESAADIKTNVTTVVPITEKAGDVIGRYKLLQKLGEGGCGVVYMAEQEQPVRRRVALKLIKLGMDTRQVVARFEAERQALALMDHPNIAKVLDAGATESGRPYFVMELVKGMPITEYCDKHKLTTRERLDLLILVCQAIQHAHQKGIIHRDIKPSNVLVASYDAKPTPKVIDFGLAKAMGQQLTEQTLFTGLWAVLGTLEYMSPEQAEVNQLDIDTRTDVYSLGVLLYELLTGTTPLKRESLKRESLDAALRRIREEEPPRPSTRLGENAETLPILSSRRNAEPGQLIKLVRTDLDWIAMKALEKDRNRRYETANGLASDLQRHLHDEPIVARPPSTVYRLHKFTRKHRRLVATAAAFAGLLACATVLSTALALWAIRERGRAESAKSEISGALRAAYLAQARATRLSDRPGRRFDALMAISNAAAIKPALDLRNEAIAAMSLMDVRLIRSLSPPEGHRLEVDPARSLYAVIDLPHKVELRDLSSNHLLVSLPTPVDDGPLRLEFLRSAPALVTSQPRRRERGWIHRFWDTASGDLLLTQTNDVPSGADFDAGSQRLAVVQTDGTISIHRGFSSHIEKELPRYYHRVAQVRFRPTGSHLAIMEESSQFVTVVSLENPDDVRAWRHHTDAVSMAWSSDGTRLAVGCVDGNVYIRDFESETRVALIKGHEGAVDLVCFHPSGRVVVSSGREGSSRFSDPTTGRLLLLAPGRCLGFEPQGFHVFLRHDAEIGIWEYPATPEHEFIAVEDIPGLIAEGRLTDVITDLQLASVTESPDGLHLAEVRTERSGTDVLRSVVITDANSGTTTFVPSSPPVAVGFSADSRCLLVATDREYELLRAPHWKAAGIQGPLVEGLERMVAIDYGSSILVAPSSLERLTLTQLTTGKQLASLDSANLKGARLLAFGNSTDELLLLNESGIEVWNLGRVRHTLAGVGLGWDPDEGLVDEGVEHSSSRPRPQLSAPHDIAIPARDTSASPDLVDLTHYYNVGLTNQWAPSKTGGGLTTTTLRALQPGIVDFGRLMYPRFSRTLRGVMYPRFSRTLRGVFDIRGLVQLASEDTDECGLSYPREIRRVPVGRKADWLQFLHAAAGRVRPGTRIGQYQVNYTDGTVETIPIIYGHELLDWEVIAKRAPHIHPHPAWYDTNALNRTTSPFAGRLFSSIWPNPRRDVTIQDLDFISTGTRAGPFLVAVSVQNESVGTPDDSAIEERRAVLSTRIPRRASGTPARLIDLSPYYNAMLDEDFHDRTAAPVSYVLTNNLQELPTGVQRLAEVDFDVRGLIQLNGLQLRAKQIRTSPSLEPCPESVLGIRVVQPASRLHFLHGTGWQTKDGEVVGHYVVHYANGARQRVPIVYGQDVRDWWFWSNEDEEAIGATIAWRGQSPHSASQGMSLRLFKMTIGMLKHDADIEAIDFISANGLCAPFLIAITVE